MASFSEEKKISDRLYESLARLRKDIDSVELWAGALEGFSQPVPDYDASRRYRLTSTQDKPAEDRPAEGQKSRP